MNASIASRWLASQGDERRAPSAGPTASSNHLTHSAIARSHYRDYQNARIGPDPLALFPHEWPALPTDLTEDQPLTGWRLWALIETPDGPRLSAPYNADHPAGIWHTRHHTASQVNCQDDGKAHPHTGCRCGLRVVQSWTVLKAFLKDQAHRMHPQLVLGTVSAWGHVAPAAPDDDWQYIARAEHLRIDDLLVKERDMHHADALAARYDVRTRQW